MSVNAVCDLLGKELVSLREKEASQRADLQETRTKRKKVSQALANLAPNRPKRSPGSGVTNAEVGRAIEAILSGSDSPPTVDALRDQVRDELERQGRPLSGFTLRFTQALKKFPVNNNTLEERSDRGEE